MHVAIGTLVAMALVFFATSLQTGAGSSLAEMLNAQRHSPQLWVVDLCAFGLIAGMWWVAVLSNHFQGYIEFQATQHLDQLNDMIERTSELEQTNDSYADQIERIEGEVTRRFAEVSEQISAMETVAEARRGVFEMEARRIAESANRDLLTQLDANTDQVEAVSATLQVHRSELRRLRHAVHGLQLSIPGANSQERIKPDWENTSPAQSADADMQVADIGSKKTFHPDGSPDLVSPECECDPHREPDALLEGPRYLLNGLGQRTPISTCAPEAGAPIRNGHAAKRADAAESIHFAANPGCHQDCTGDHMAETASEPISAAESIA